MDGGGRARVMVAGGSGERGAAEGTLRKVHCGSDGALVSLVLQYEKHKAMGVEAKDADPETVSAAFGPVLPLVYLEKAEGGIHIGKDPMATLKACARHSP